MNIRGSILILGLSILVLPFSAKAVLLFEFDIAQDVLQINNTTTITNSKMYYSSGVYKDFWLKGRLFFGLNYFAGSVLHTPAGAASTTLSNQDFFISAKYFLDKKNIFSVDAAYGISSQAIFRSPSITASEQWKGSSYRIRGTIAPEVWKRTHIGVSYNYYLATYTSKNVSGVESAINNYQNFSGFSLTAVYDW